MRHSKSTPYKAVEGTGIVISSNLLDTEQCGLQERDGIK